MNMASKCSLSLIFISGCGTTPVTAGTSDDSAQAAADVASTQADVAPRSSACGKFDDGVYGKKHPWTGFAQGGKTYTCNICRGGSPSDQGLWRLIDTATESPATPLGGFRETLAFDGNTWHGRLQGDDNGKQVDAAIDGWFWCTDPSELPSGNAVFIAETVKPEGAFGWASGMVSSGGVKSKGNDLRALGLFSGFESGQQNDWRYCRVGSTINGVPCSDPFKN